MRRAYHTRVILPVLLGCASFIFLSTLAAVAQDLPRDFAAAVSLGRVKARLYGLGRTAGNSIVAQVTNNTAEKQTLAVASGTVLLPSSSQYRRMVVRRVTGRQGANQLFSTVKYMMLEPQETRAFILAAYSLDYKKQVPGPETGFALGSVDQQARAVLDAAAKAELSAAATQAAIWLKVAQATPAEVKRRIKLSPAELAAAESLRVRPAPAVEPLAVKAPPEAGAGLAPMVLKEGTPVFLLTTTALTSGQSAEGQVLKCSVVAEVLGPERQVLIKPGAPARAKVLESTARGSGGRAGRVAVMIESVLAADGTTVPLRGLQVAVGKAHKLGGALGLGGLPIKGRNITLPEGTEMVGFVTQDTWVSPLPPGSRPTAPPTESVELKVPHRGRVLQGERLAVSVEPSNPARALGYRLLIDGTEVLKREKNFDLVEVSTRGLEVGWHSLLAEVKFTDGVVKQPIEFEVLSAIH